MTDPYIQINGTKIEVFDNDLSAVRTIKQLDEDPISGWIPAPNTGIYAAVNRIAVGSGAALIFQKSDRIRWKQGAGYIYGYVLAVGSNYIDLVPNTDFTVANAPITDMAYSHIDNPLGFPHWFNITAPSFTVASYDNGAGGQPTTTECRFKISGNQYTAHYGGTGTKAGTTLAIVITSSSFITPVNSTNAVVGFAFAYVSTTVAYVGVVDTAFACRFNTTIADNSVIALFGFTVTYEI